MNSFAYVAEALALLATAGAGAFVILLKRIDNKHGATGARIGKVQDELNAATKKVAVLENKVEALESKTANNACKDDIREMEARLTKRIDALAAELKESRK